MVSKKTKQPSIIAYGGVSATIRPFINQLELTLVVAAWLVMELHMAGTGTSQRVDGLSQGPAESRSHWTEGIIQDNWEYVCRPKR